MLYDCGVIVMKWKEVNGIRQGEYSVYEDGVVKYIGYWENVFGSGDIIRLLNRKKGKLMQLIDRNKRTRVYLGGYNSKWEPHGKGIEFNRSTGLPMYESIWKNGVRTHIIKEIRNTKMIEYSEEYTNIELSNKLPIYCGGFLYDETADEFLRHGMGCLLDKFGCAIEEALWEKGKKKSSTQLKDGWYFLSASPKGNADVKNESVSETVPIFKVNSSVSKLDKASNTEIGSRKDGSVDESTKKDTSSKKSTGKKEDPVDNGLIDNASIDNLSIDNLSTDNVSKGSKSKRRRSKKNASKNDSSKNDSSSIMNDLIDIFGTDFGTSSSTDKLSSSKTKYSTEETTDVSTSQPTTMQQVKEQSGDEVVVKSQEELENANEARSIIVAPNSCNDELTLILLSHCCLERLRINNNCYCNVTNVKISFLSNLKTLEISKNSFVSEKSKGGSLLIKECSSLESILISHHSFQYFTSFKLQDLCRLKTLRVGESMTESLCFRDASFEIKCSCVYFY